jgi:hypothetical protein
MNNVFEPIPTRSRKRSLPPTRHRALELLASSRDGCSEAIMIAHGFTVSDIVLLVHAGLATATAKRVIADSQKIEVATVRITEAGRQMLERAKR